MVPTQLPMAALPLKKALESADAVKQAVQGRKTLGQQRPASRSPKRQTTLLAELRKRSRAYVAAGGATDSLPSCARP